MKSIKKIFFYCTLSSLIVFGISSCKKEEGHAAPTITRIRTVFQSSQSSQTITPFDSTTTDGKIGTRYAIIGNNLSSVTSILINGVSIYFNQALSSNTALQFSIPQKFAFGGSVNTLTVISPYGQVTTPFSVLQPGSSITSFTPVSGGAGSIVTIIGTIFDNLLAVRFGDIPAEIVGTPTKTQIQVKVPAGITNAFIYVETAGGISKSLTPFGYKYLAYGDVVPAGWSLQNYNGATSSTSTEMPNTGTMSMKNTYPAGAYGGFKYYYNGPDISTATLGLTSIKFSVFLTGTTDKQVALGLSGNYDKRVVLQLKAGKWNDYTEQLSSFASPATITAVEFQDFSGGGYTIYVDDVGFN